MNRKLKASAVVLASILMQGLPEARASIMTAGLSLDNTRQYQLLPLSAEAAGKGNSSADYAKLHSGRVQYSGSKGLSQDQAEGLRRKRFVVSTHV
ncbi:MAG: hypothetical protein Q7V63_04310 [Gammaproteobacteria bacterium]|nr:hypothetical protein [Gammaproteobacteria bacterium]